MIFKILIVLIFSIDPLKSSNKILNNKKDFEISEKKYNMRKFKSSFSKNTWIKKKVNDIVIARILNNHFRGKTKFYLIDFRL